MAGSVAAMWAWAVDRITNYSCAYTQSLEVSPGAPYGKRNMGYVDGKYWFDCASFVYFALIGGGFPAGDYYGSGHYAPNVTGLVGILPQMGFTSYPAASSTWQAGDILIKYRTHTEICYAPPSRTMGAHSTAGGVTINAGDSTKSYYDVLFRYEEGPGPDPPGPQPGPTVPMPIWLLKRAIEIQRGG